MTTPPTAPESTVSSAVGDARCQRCDETAGGVAAGEDAGAPRDCHCGACAENRTAPAPTLVRRRPPRFRARRGSTRMAAVQVQPARDAASAGGRRRRQQRDDDRQRRRIRWRRRLRRRAAAARSTGHGAPVCARSRAWPARRRRRAVLTGALLVVSSRGTAAKRVEDEAHGSVPEGRSSASGSRGPAAAIPTANRALTRWTIALRRGGLQPRPRRGARSASRYRPRRGRAASGRASRDRPPHKTRGNPTPRASRSSRQRRAVVVSSAGRKRRREDGERGVRRQLAIGRGRAAAARPRSPPAPAPAGAAVRRGRSGWCATTAARRRRSARRCSAEAPTAATDASITTAAAATSDAFRFSQPIRTACGDLHVEALGGVRHHLRRDARRRGSKTRRAARGRRSG